MLARAGKKQNARSRGLSACGRGRTCRRPAVAGGAWKAHAILLGSGTSVPPSMVTTITALAKSADVAIIDVDTDTCHLCLSVMSCQSPSGESCFSCKSQSARVSIAWQKARARNCADAAKMSESYHGLLRCCSQSALMLTTGHKRSYNPQDEVATIPYHSHVAVSEN